VTFQRHGFAEPVKVLLVLSGWGKDKPGRDAFTAISGAKEIAIILVS